MHRLLQLIVLFAMFCVPASAQEDAEVDPETAATETTETEEPQEAEEPVVDDEFYQDVDDEDFRPSEDIPADQSIPFPTDI